MDGVVAPLSAECHDCGVGLATASSPSRPLLIVESLRRHICLHNYTEPPDIDTNLHGRGDTQEVDRFDEFRAIAIENNIPEVSLPGGLVIRLACQLLGMESEGAAPSADHRGVVIIFVDIFALARGIGVQVRVAVATNAGGFMQVNLAALPTLPIRIIR